MGRAGIEPATSRFTVSEVDFSLALLKVLVKLLSENDHKDRTNLSQLSYHPD